MSMQAAAGDRRKCRVQPGLTGTNARLEKGGSAAVATAAMVAQGDKVRPLLLRFTAGG